MADQRKRKTARKRREGEGTRGGAAAAAAPDLKVPSGYQIPERIYAQASPHSSGGVSLFEAQYQIGAGTIANFASEPEMIDAAVHRLAEAGFEILQVSLLSINIAGSQETYQRAFQTQIQPEERPVIKPIEGETTATFLDSPDTELNGLIETRGTAFEDVLEGVAIEEPRYFMAPSAFAPAKAYWHLRVPGDISLGTNADRAHRAGLTGSGIRVAMVDSGWFKHPYFVGRGYRVAPVTLGPGAANPFADESGHGTGESANIFAVAPDAQLLPVKMNFTNTIGAFNAAVGLQPHIITCSWGSSNQLGPLSAADQALAAAIAAAVASGIIVVFSAGNGHFGFPGQHPNVISAGGVFMNPDGTLRASDYASGFLSNIYPGRRVPDLCGLVGMLPKAIYIMLPVEPGDEIDVSLAGGAHPAGDETANNDGWAAFSGTSAAAPQLAGAAALVKQACSRLTPAEVRDVLMKSARDVTTGACNPATGANPATPGPDLATGYGLVDAQKAAMVARLRCLGPSGAVLAPPAAAAEEMGPVPIGPVHPIQPIRPIEPIQPVQPVEPIQPVQPVHPIQPIQPVQPVRPIKPIQPVKPIKPIKPIEPIQPVKPIKPIKPIEPIEPIQPVKPIKPIKPIHPIKPIKPIEPIHPIEPIKPIQPVEPIQVPIQVPGEHEEASGAAGAGGAGASQPGRLSAEEVQAIEDIILDTGFNPGDQS